MRACAVLQVARDEVVLCLYFDGCTDSSEAAVRSAAPALPFRLICHSGALHPDANAGRARQAAMAMGVRALDGAADGILLSTDADSQPDPDWVRAAHRALDVADAAAGRLIRVGGERDTVQTRLERYLDRLHAYRRTLDPVPWDMPGGCHFSGGANLGVRVGVYQALGGFRPMPSGEDATFLDDAARGGWRVRRDTAMIVRTSSRRQGRAPDGLAAALENIDAHGLSKVVHPAAAEWQYRAHAIARRTFANLAHEPARAALGRVIGLSADHVLGVGRDCPNAEAFCMRIVPTPADGTRSVPLSEAEDALTSLERLHCEVAA